MKTKLLATLIPALAFTAGSLHAADYAAGVGLGPGVGATFSIKNNLHFRNDDQVQTRFELYGADIDDEDGIEISGIDYEGDIDLTTAKATMDWYPFNEGWGRKVFFSGGLTYMNSEIDADAELDKSFKIGAQQINPGDIQGLNVDIEQDPVSPYLGIGWGNKIGKESGFSFMVEVGVGFPTSDPDVNLTLTDANNVVSAADLAKEKKQLEDDLDGAFGMGSIAVTYHF